MQKNQRYIRVLSIAGSDSGGGAGIQADIKTISALGCYAMTAIAALTAQNTQRVTSIFAPPPEFLTAQLDAVLSDIGVDAVKIGMLHSTEVVKVVRDAILRYRVNDGSSPIVLDPVMVSTSGSRLIEEKTVQLLIDELFPLADLITPNLDEAVVLLGRDIAHESDLEDAAQALVKLGCKAVLLKGGHLPGNEVVDMLAMRGQDGEISLARFSSPRIQSDNVHGTGCTLSSAIACFLAQKESLPKAVESARAYILRAIAAGCAYQTGKGSGPLNHSFAPIAMRSHP